MLEEPRFILIALVALGIGAQFLAWRLNLPSILLLLTIGIVAGPMTGLLNPDLLLGDLLVPVVSLSVALILYEGGLSLRLRELRRVGVIVRNLATIGALTTWVGASFAVNQLFDVDPRIALLLGAIFIVTGPTVIGPMLRHIRPVGAAGPALKWEGIVTDPIGAMTAVLVFEAILHGSGATGATLLGVLKTLVLGSAIGAIGALILSQAISRHWLPDFLQNPISLVFVFVVYGACDLVQAEAGLAGVTVMGVVLANQKAARVRHIIEFKENLQVLLLSTIFVLLAARVPSDILGSISWHYFAFLAVLVLLIRPAGVFLSSIGSSLNWRERTFIAGVAPRGIVSAAVASVLALELEHSGETVLGSELIVPLAFFIIIGTVVIYGLLSPILARVLGISQPGRSGFLLLGAQPWARALARTMNDAGCGVLIVDSNRRNVMRARLEGLAVVQDNMLAEGSLEDVDLSGIGNFLALTSNDEVNALACHRMEEVVGRSHVFQLLPTEEDGGDEELEMGGRRLFGDGMTYFQLGSLFRQGWVFKATGISEEFTVDDYQQRYGEKAKPLFIVDPQGGVQVISHTLKLSPRGGDSLIAVVEDIPNTPAVEDLEPQIEGL